jgi:hypothetical protein
MLTITLNKASRPLTSWFDIPYPYPRRDYVKKIAVYKDKLAVQLPTKVVIYELANPSEYFLNRSVLWNKSNVFGWSLGPLCPGLSGGSSCVSALMNAMPGNALAQGLQGLHMFDFTLIDASGTGDDYDMRYQSATKITQKLECNLLVVTSSHVILCQVSKPQTCNFLLEYDMTAVCGWSRPLTLPGRHGVQHHSH